MVTVNDVSEGDFVETTVGELTEHPTRVTVEVIEIKSPSDSTTDDTSQVARMEVVKVHDSKSSVSPGDCYVGRFSESDDRLPTIDT